MPRIRSVKPELVHDPRLATRSDTARILYYAVLAVVDDHGRAQAAPAYLHGVAFWGRPRSHRTVAAARDELAAAGVWHLYDLADGGHYLEVVGFSKTGHLFHQRIEHRQASSLPAPESIPSTVVPRPPADEPLRHPLSNQDQAQDQAQEVSPELTLDHPAPPKPSDHTRVRDHFVERFKGANNGAAPTWNGREGKLLKSLLAQHSADEVLRRIGIMFDAPPAWPTTRDLATLAGHFDKFASPTIGNHHKPVANTERIGVPEGVNPFRGRQ